MSNYYFTAELARLRQADLIREAQAQQHTRAARAARRTERAARRTEREARVLARRNAPVGRRTPWVRWLRVAG